MAPPHIHQNTLLLIYNDSHANDHESRGNDAVVSAVVEEVRRQPLHTIALISSREEKRVGEPVGGGGVREGRTEDVKRPAAAVAVHLRTDSRLRDQTTWPIMPRG